MVDDPAGLIGAEVHHLVNEEREERGLSPLTGHPELISTARSHSRTMAETGNFSHTAGGTTAQQRCGGFRRVGENIHKTYTTAPPTELAKEAVQSWLDSEGHRENMLRSQFAYDGVGVWIVKDAIYFTHEFAVKQKRTSFLKKLIGL